MAAKIKSADITKPNAILGMFDGECMDSAITNLNGLDITSEVMDVVFSSDEYRQGIDKGWYIGFLGHPEDPNEMGFQDGCIVMTEGHMDKDGKVYGKFNLIDTPVGRIVKTFIDAGVKFGISIRGAGDIENNSVDPETFVFRGFDLVSFPAYPESIPVFTEIAASTNAKDRAMYKKICASVANNLQEITSVAALNIIQSNFAPQSKEYKMLEERRNAIEASEMMSLNDARVAGMTELYLEAISANSILSQEIESLKLAAATSSQRTNKMKRIVSSQLSEVTSDRDSLAGDNSELVQANLDLEDYQEQLLQNNKLMEQTITDLEDYITELEQRNKKLLRDIKSSENSNLIYMRKIESHQNELSDKDSVIASLQSELDETVNAGADLETRTSNLGVNYKDLKSEVKASNRQLREYQIAYGKLYASAVGGDNNLESLPITASTSIVELQSLISSGDSTHSFNDYMEPQPVGLSDDGDEIISL
jgi:hypothetical protein